MADPNNKALMKAAAAVDGKEWNDEDVPSKKSASVSSSSCASDDEGGPTTSESISSAGASGTKQKCKTEASKKKKQAKPLKVCTYKDRQDEEPVFSKKMAGTLAINKTLPAKEPTFPVKLHMILSNSSLESIISWLPHGRSWRILQQSEFEEKVIPLYFRHGKYNSFARQVSGWGFKRISAGADFNSYYHELFLRGKPHLCHLMKRLTAKESAIRKESKRSGQADASIVPDFYLMDRTKPLPLNDPKDARPLPDYLLKSVGPGVQSNQTSEIKPVHGAISGTVKSDTIPTQASTTMPPPPPVITNNNMTMVVATLLSAMLSTGQIQPHQLAAVLGLSAAAQPPPVVPQPSQQPTFNSQAPYYQLALNMAAASGQTGGGGLVLPTPAPAASAFYQPPAQQDPPKKSENLMAELVQAYQQAQHVQAQPQVAAHHHHHCPVQQPQPQQPMTSHPQHQSRENNTTGQTIANFLIDRSQHKQQMIQEKHDKKQQLVQQEQVKQQQQQLKLQHQQQEQQQQPAAAPPDIAALLLQSLQQAQQQPQSAPLAQQNGSGIADLATWLFSQQSGPPPNP